MNFGYEEGVIYLHSAPEGRVIRALEQKADICITFSTDHALAFQHPEVACSYRMKSKSVVAFGRVPLLTDWAKNAKPWTSSCANTATRPSATATRPYAT